jgi:hypothetical protein
MIEARPLTKERIIARYLDELLQSASEQYPLINKFDDAAESNAIVYLRKRREQLLEILRKSIELNEPLVCSL